MDPINQREMLYLLHNLKALADERRLKLVGLLSQDEHTVGDLAEVLGLSEATISHHISKLRTVGFLNLRSAGNQRFYRMRPGALAQVAERVERLEAGEFDAAALADDQAWIDALDIDEDARKVLRNYTEFGRLTRIPSKQAKLIVVLDWLVTAFEAGRTYTEAEVNAIIRERHDDFATLRRELVEFGYLRRERGGGAYWLAPETE